MKKRTLLLYLFLALMSPICATAQSSDALDLLSSSKTYFEQNPVFQTQLTYTLFRDKDNPVVIRSYDGILVKKQDDLYLKIHNTEFLLTKDALIKVNHDQEAIEYTAGNTEAISQNPMAIDQYLTLFADSEVTQQGNQTVCVLTTPKYTQLPYGAIDLFFNTENGALNKQILTLVNPGAIPNENGEMDASLKYLAIEFKQIQIDPPNVSSYFESSKFVSGGKKTLSAATALSNYKLIDRSIK